MATLTSLFETPEPAHLTMKPRAGTKSVAELNEAITEVFAGSKADRLTIEAAHSALLLWHDHFEASHEIAQNIGNADGSLLHGILHRREPDFSNARYWFRRVGNHPSFDCVAVKVKGALLTSGVDLEAVRIIPNDKWHPLAFMDVLEEAARTKPSRYDKLFREIQRAEIECFVESLLTR